MGDVLVYTRAPDFLLQLAALVAFVSLIAVYFGELLPLGLAANHGVRLSLAIAPTVLLFTKLLSPFLLAIARLANIRSDRRETTTTITQTEIRQLSVLGHSGERASAQRHFFDMATLEPLVTHSASPAPAWGSGRRPSHRAPTLLPAGRELTPLAPLPRPRGQRIRAAPTTRRTPATP
jgi:hypothetical protein